MPRANRYFLPGYVWHITHRCHKKEFLLKFAKDRARWLYWLFEARKRYGLCVLNYVVTSNHIHLLVKDTGKNIIAQSMRLIAGRTAQEYNIRKKRKGAYWEDRYHATAVQSDDYLSRCMAYIDLNMVRAGVVDHPKEWAHGGYVEIQSPPERYRIIDLTSLMEFTGAANLERLQNYYRKCVESQLKGINARDENWTKSIAVGSESFVEEICSLLGQKVKSRNVVEERDKFVLKEPDAPYNVVFDPKIGALRAENTYFWDSN
jgi:putative transposase